MRFEIPFKETNTRKDSKLVFDSYWESLLKKNKKTLYFIIPFILLGGLMVYGNDNVGFLFVAAGFHYLFNYFNYLNYYKKSRILYFNRVEENIKTYTSYNQPSIWKFEDEYFCYSDFQYDLKIKWISFKVFKIIDDSLFFELKDTITGNFLLSKEEVGSENFEKIIAFLESKIKKDGIL